MILVFLLPTDSSVFNRYLAFINRIAAIVNEGIILLLLGAPLVNVAPL